MNYNSSVVRAWIENYVTESQIEYEKKVFTNYVCELLNRNTPAHILLSDLEQIIPQQAKEFVSSLMQFIDQSRNAQPALINLQASNQPNSITEINERLETKESRIDRTEEKIPETIYSKSSSKSKSKSSKKDKRKDKKKSKRKYSYSSDYYSSEQYYDDTETSSSSDDNSKKRKKKDKKDKKSDKKEKSSSKSKSKSKKEKEISESDSYSDYSYYDESYSSSESDSDDNKSKKTKSDSKQLEKPAKSSSSKDKKDKNKEKSSKSERSSSSDKKHKSHHKSHKSRHDKPKKTIIEYSQSSSDSEQPEKTDKLDFKKSVSSKPPKVTSYKQVEKPPRFIIAVCGIEESKISIPKLYNYFSKYGAIKCIQVNRREYYGLIEYYQAEHACAAASAPKHSLGDYLHVTLASNFDDIKIDQNVIAQKDTNDDNSMILSSSSDEYNEAD